MTVYVADSGRRYTVVEDNGTAGGFSSVVTVEDECRRRHALKSLRLRGLSPELLRNEAESLAATDHPNVIAFRDAGRVPEPFLVVELATSGSLRDRLSAARRRTEHVPLPTLVDWADQLLDALAAVHAHMLHCDINPANVLFCGPVPKIADFGSARPLSRTSPVSAFATAPSSRPPEGWLGARARPPAPAYDLYGVGAVLYEVATLHPPFAGNTDDVRVQHLIRRPPRPTLLRPDLPDAIEGLVLQLLEKDPDRRGGSATACREQLRSFAADSAPEYD